MKNFLLKFYFYFLLFSRKQNFFLGLQEKSYKKEANNLRQVDRLCAWGVYHAKPDEATLTLRSSVLCGNSVLRETFSRSDSRLSRNDRSPAFRFCEIFFMREPWQKIQGNSIYFLNEFYLLERSRRKTNMKFVSQ